MAQIQPLEEKHWPSVRQIYLEGIATGQATFETSAPEWETWDKSHISSHRYIAGIDGKIAGWAALTPISGRCVYAGVAEVSVYVGQDYRGQKIGNQLLNHLIESSEQDGFWTLQAGIFAENTASIKLHEKHGFRVIGFRENLGKMNGAWRNVNLLERRSKIIGIN